MLEEGLTGFEVSNGRKEIHFKYEYIKFWRKKLSLLEGVLNV